MALTVARRDRTTRSTRLLWAVAALALVGTGRCQRPAHRRSRCGQWRQPYAALHARILAGTAPPRYLFHLCDEGLADCAVGAASALYLAVATDRALFTGKFSYHHFYNDSYSGHLEAAFTRPAIDWRVPSDLIAHQLPNAEHVTLLGVTQPVISDTKIASIYSQAAGPASSVVVFSNAGITHRMLNVSAVRQHLTDLGVTQDNAFGCAFEFLFRPHPLPEDRYADEAAIFSKPRKLPVIAVHVRTGDVAFDTAPRTGDMEPATRFAGILSCVRDIKQHARAAQAAIYIISDSVAARQSLARLFPDDVVVANTNVPLQHSGPYQKSAPVTEDGLRTAATEFWLFGEADYHIAYRTSGYGRAAAGRVAARKRMHLYVLDDYSTPTTCAPGREVGMATVGAMMPGI
jgi:hypothetical protein